MKNKKALGKLYTEASNLGAKDSEQLLMHKVLQQLRELNGLPPLHPGPPTGSLSGNVGDKRQREGEFYQRKIFIF